MEKEEKSWQSISLDFFEEIIKDYFEKRDEVYDKKVIELYTDSSSSVRIFLDNISQEIMGKSEYFNKFKKNVEGRGDILENLDENSLFKDLIGSVIMISKEDSDDEFLVRVGEELLKNYEKVEGVDESSIYKLKNLIEKIKKRHSARLLPMTKSYIQKFLWEGIIISTPPNVKNFAGVRLEPMWYIKTKTGEEISGDKLLEKHWRLGLSERFIKIRALDYDEGYKELLGK